MDYFLFFREEWLEKRWRRCLSVPSCGCKENCSCGTAIFFSEFLSSVSLSLSLCLSLSLLTQAQCYNTHYLCLSNIIFLLCIPWNNSVKYRVVKTNFSYHFTKFLDEVQNLDDTQPDTGTGPKTQVLWLWSSAGCTTAARTLVVMQSTKEAGTQHHQTYDSRDFSAGRWVHSTVHWVPLRMLPRAPIWGAKLPPSIHSPIHPEWKGVQEVFSWGRPAGTNALWIVETSMLSSS